MSKFSLSVYLNAYSDEHSSNNPSRNNFRWNRDLRSILVNNPTNQANQIAPGETLNFFNGSRTLAQDNTTEYSISLLPSTGYELSWSGGTAPNFRTPRTSGADATTAVTAVVNGPIVTFSGPAVVAAFATFSGVAPGTATSVLLTANTIGTGGNAIALKSNSVFASFTGQVSGMTTNITLTAETAGANGNSIELVGDGASTITTLVANWNLNNASNLVFLTSGDGTQVPSLSATIQLAGGLTAGAIPINTLITNWNTANPSNQVTLTSGDGTQMPSAGSTIQLTGGANAATALNLTGGGVVVGDYVSIGSNFNALNQGTFQVIAVTATSFTVQNPTGTNEGPILLGSGFATQLQFFSAAGVQVGDTLVISGGFSPATQGSYEVTQVFANSLHFATTGSLPVEGPIQTEAITIYSMAKNLVYIESDSALNVIVNGVDIGTIEPFLIPNSLIPSAPPDNIPGVFMLKSTVWSLSVTNNGLNPANCYFAAVE